MSTDKEDPILALTTTCAELEQTMRAKWGATLPLTVRTVELHAAAGCDEVLKGYIQRSKQSIVVRLAEGDRSVQLRAARAWGELAELERMRAALGASADGISQREIGRMLGVPQTEVHRMLRRARNGEHSVVTDSPREVILHYNVGLITRGTMVGRLTDPSEGTSDPDGIDGYVAGPWDQIRDAYLDGLLTEEEYEQLRDVRFSPGRRRAVGPALGPEAGADAPSADLEERSLS